MLEKLKRLFGKAPSSHNITFGSAQSERIVSLIADAIELQLTMAQRGGPSEWSKRTRSTVLGCGSARQSNYRRATSQLAFNPRVRRLRLHLESLGQCDNLDILSPMPLANHTAFRVGCIGKDGNYRTYVMARQVGSNGNFTMEFTK